MYQLPEEEGQEGAEEDRSQAAPEGLPWATTDPPMIDHLLVLLAIAKGKKPGRREAPQPERFVVPDPVAERKRDEAYIEQRVQDLLQKWREKP